MSSIKYAAVKAWSLNKVSSPLLDYCYSLQSAISSTRSMCLTDDIALCKNLYSEWLKLVWMQTCKAKRNFFLFQALSFHSIILSFSTNTHLSGIKTNQGNFFKSVSISVVTHQIIIPSSIALCVAYTPVQN